MGLLDFSPAVGEIIKNKVSKDMQVLPDFISPKEETSLMEELEVKFKRARYQYDHWDDVIPYNVFQLKLDKSNLQDCRRFTDTEKRRNPHGMKWTLWF